MTAVVLSLLSCSKESTKPAPGSIGIEAGDEVRLLSSSGFLTGKVSGSEAITSKWEQISGPSEVEIVSPDSLTTSIRQLTTGVYWFRLTATGSSGVAGKDSVRLVAKTGHYTDTLFIYLSAGQSNMDGRAGSPFPYASAAMVVDGVNVWQWGSPAHNSFQSFEYDRYNGSQSPGTPRWAGDIIAARKIRDSLYRQQRPVYLLKVTRGGSALSPFTREPACWTIPQDSVPAGRERMFDTLKNRLNAVRQWSYDQDSARYIKVVGMMWHQGESDKWATAAYQYRLTRLFAAIRQEVNDPVMPIVMGTITSSSADYSPLIHQAQLNIAKADPHIAIVEMDGQPLLPDGVHFNATAQTYFGDQLYSIIKTFAR
ncbi:sialate O-acetylesterase [Flavihumibacter petaseus]|uniref:Sialate O-acetylesterase domain-containing protein n=1 Tax=Flavihumibacter petaseus NBRC 106054 TaxID=1220578 RepID=A0A0E9N2U9_9BACT|nr:sialate O-acetylesterase [Flavihumibacter petaseus]GAO43675.1 hypothetical protein FPE01S_02_07810 [Flavihumibacter petaseus NBRC 106054]